MAKDRGTCIHYKFEGKGGCDLNKKCEYWGHCQTCPTWKRKPGAKPPRTDNRRAKADKIQKKELRRYDY